MTSPPFLPSRFPASHTSADVSVSALSLAARQSYLNPNGLKYHLEKGTCTNADARARDPLPALGSFALPPSHGHLTVAAAETATKSKSNLGLSTEDSDVAHAEAAEGRA